MNRPPCQRGRKRRSGDCVERSSRSWKWHFKIEEPLRHAASFKRHLAARQSLRHGLRPCHLPLTREAKRLRPPIGPLVKGGWLRRKPQTGGLCRKKQPFPEVAFQDRRTPPPHRFFQTAVGRKAIPPSRPAAVPPPFNKGGKEVAAVPPPFDKGGKEVAARQRPFNKGG